MRECGPVTTTPDSPAANDVAPSGVTVRYTLDVNEWTMVIDGNRLLDKDAVEALY